MSTFNRERRSKPARIDSSAESGNSSDQTSDDDDEEEEESDHRARLELLLRPGATFSARLIDTPRPQHRRATPLAIGNMDTRSGAASTPHHSNTKMDTDDNEDALSNDENLIQEQEEKTASIITAKASATKEIDIPKATEGPSSNNNNSNNLSVGESGFGDEFRSIPSSVDSTQMTSAMSQSSSLNTTQMQSIEDDEREENGDVSSLGKKAALAKGICGGLKLRDQKIRAEAARERLGRENLMRERIMQLPLSNHVKEFLLYYRTA
jgi:hypothetical protein